MRSAPPVSWPVGRFHLGAILALALLGAGLALTGFWFHEAPGWRPLVGLAAWLAWGAWAWGRRSQPTGVLTWDGQGWHWWPDGDEAGSRPVDAQLALDFQRLVLLRLQPVGERPTRPWTFTRSGPIWLWLTPSGDPGRWRDFRRALYSRRIREVG